MGKGIARKVPLAIRQRGQAILLVALLMIMAVTAVIYVTVSSTSVAIANRQSAETDKALAQVKDALIAWSAARTPTGAAPNLRPGELPCPDIDNSGTDSGSCSAGAIGRVPWKSLGIPEPKDGTGETLWYAISGPFRNYSMNSAPITSNTQGNLTVYHGSSATTLTSQAIAIVFAPGSPQGSQDRSTSTTAVCSTTGTTIARNLCATNYLESTGGGNNAQTGGPFIQASASGTFNDRLLAITNEDLMPLVEQRVAREMIAYLNAYKAATATSLLFDLIPLSPGVYPWADLADGDSNGSAGAAYNRNRFPCGNALPVDWGSSMALWPLLGSGTTPALPNWLTNGCAALTGWASVIYYTVAQNRLASGIGSLLTTCSTCSASSLTVTNGGSYTGSVCSTASPPVCTTQVITSGNADLILITPGGYTGSPARSWPVSFTTISGYFEDAENRDNNDDSYVVPTATTPNRDRIYVVR